MTQDNFVPVAAVADVPAGTVKKIEAGGLSILLCNSKDQIFAVINRCSHADEELACGRMKAGWIACPIHGARFSLETGEAMNPPAKDPIRTFPVRIVADMIEIAI